ncbi:MAG: alpha/beta hydrolase, partial [Deltaproteobacteria bacterium]|nr:alpha/beta hydrolase [Deltaproteobacteria bacterium]
LIKALSANYRTIVPDHIGCGLSDEPKADNYDYTLARRVSDLEVVLDRLGAHNRTTLILHDWGGMIGMAYAVKHPERISRIIILNTAAFLPPAGKKLPLRLRLVRNVKWLSRPAVLGLNLFARSALYMASQSPLDREVKQGLIAPYDRPENRIATLRFVYDIPVCPTDASYDLVAWVSNQLERLAHLPMLICWGKHDFVFDTDYLAEWRRRFPKAEYHLLSNAGHYILEDAPETVYEPKGERDLFTCATNSDCPPLSSFWYSFCSWDWAQAGMSCIKRSRREVGRRQQPLTTSTCRKKSLASHTVLFQCFITGCFA